MRSGRNDCLVEKVLRNVKIVGFCNGHFNRFLDVRCFFFPLCTLFVKWIYLQRKLGIVKKLLEVNYGNKLILYIAELVGGENYADLGAEFTWNFSLVWSGKTWSSEYKTDCNLYCVALLLHPYLIGKQP